MHHHRRAGHLMQFLQTSDVINMRVRAHDEAHSKRMPGQQRENAMGKWQGPLVVAPGSVALCIGLGSMRDDLVTELLVRILRTQDIDARHLSLDDLGQMPPPGTSAGGVSMLFIVTAAPADEWARVEDMLPRLRERFSGVVFVGLLPEGEFAPADEALDVVVRSFEDASAEAVVRYAKTP